MAVHGFATQASANRRRTVLFVALYFAAFFAIAMLVMAIFPILLGNSARSILVDPLAYSIDYWLWGIALPIAIFGWTTHTFRREMREILQVREVRPGTEERLASIADAQATLQGLRSPKLGIIETPARNALTVGALAGKPTIAATRGLLDSLDDDELAAVLAHEIAHWRVGDVRVIWLNQLLLRTALTLQANNPFRIEKHPTQKIPLYLLFGILLPIFLIALFVGGMITMAMWRVSRFANSGVRAGRDMIADAEAVRTTHFPEALETAIAKCYGNGWFDNAQRVEAMLFDGATNSQGGTHPEPAERTANLRRFAGKVYAGGRVRRDTRTAVHSQPLRAANGNAGFGRRGLATAAVAVGGGGGGFGRANADRPEIEEWTVKRGLTFWTDPDSHRQWRRDLLDWFTWWAEDRRDIFGVAPDMRAWAYGALATSLIIGIAISPTFEDYVDYVTARQYFASGSPLLDNMTCSFSHTLEECEAMARESAS